MRVVTINTYGGSLLLGARMAGLEVDYSLEDSKFGVDIQRMNFPDLKIIQDPRYWPTIDLSDHCVIAHPPCSAFSVQNNSESRKGVGSDAFACTIRALEYSMKNKARAILVESVMGALEGARELHDEFAQRYGYSIFRFLVNSASFGVPQWRPRFWAAWVKNQSRAEYHEVNGPEGQQITAWVDYLPQPTWPVYFKPNYVKLRSVLVPDEDLYSKPRRVDGQVKAPMRKNEEAWDRNEVPQEVRDEIFQGKRGFGLANTLISGSKDYGKWAPAGFRSKHLRILDPDGFAPTLLLDSGWLMPGPRELYVEEYYRIMGFPSDYKMPERYLKSQFKMYLSKGVCPPVAAWFLEQAKYWWGGTGASGPSGIFVRPRETVDLRPIEKKENL